MGQFLSLVLIYNLWKLFARLLEPSRHLEAAVARRWFLLIATKLVKSARQLAVCLSTQGAWWQQLCESYTRVARWLAAIAPQLAFPPPPQPQIQAGKSTPTAEFRLNGQSGGLPEKESCEPDTIEDESATPTRKSPVYPEALHSVAAWRCRPRYAPQIKVRQ